MLKIEDADEYEQAYKKHVLSKLTPEEVIRDLEMLVPDQEEVILLCFEKDIDTCHRRFAAKWLSKELPYKITEIQPLQKAKKTHTQMNLLLYF